MNLEALGANDSKDGMSSFDGVGSNSSTEEPSNITTTEISSGVLRGSGHSNEEISINTPYRRPPYTSIKSGDSLEEPLVSTPSQSTSVASVIHEELRRELSNVSSSQSTSGGSVGGGDSSSEHPISTPSHTTSVTSFVSDSSADEESTNDAVVNGFRSKEPPSSKYICTSRPLPIGSHPSKSRSDNEMDSDPSFIAEVPSTSWSTQEHCRDQVSSKSRKSSPKSDGFNNILDDLVVCSEESYHLDDPNPLEIDRFSETSEVLLRQQCSGEDFMVEMESVSYPNAENHPSILSRPECLSREGTPITAKSNNIPDGSFIVRSPNVDIADSEADDLGGFETNRESSPAPHAMQDETRSSSVTGFRADFSRSINFDKERAPISRKRDRSSLKRSCSSRYRTSTYKSVGLDNILVRSNLISSPESQASENEAEERPTFNPHQGTRSASHSLLHQQLPNSARSLMSHSSRSNGGEQFQNSKERECPSEERPRSRNPCISFMDNVIEEHSEGEYDSTFEDRLETSRSSQRNLPPISDALSPVNPDIDIEADVHQTPIGDVSTLSEIEMPRSQITRRYQSRSLRISSDSSSSRDEGPSRLFPEVSSPDGSPRPVFRPCPWSPSILTWSTPTGSWYGDEPFPEHFPALSTSSSTSSRDHDPQEDVPSFSFEDQLQLSDPNRQPSDFFVLSPQRSRDQQNPLSLFEEQSPLRLMSEESYVPLNESPQRFSHQESRHQPRPIPSIREQPVPQLANQQYVSMDTPPQHSRYQPSPLSLDGEHPIRISPNRQFSASVDTSPEHSSERESMQHIISLASIQEPYLRVFKNRRYSASSDTPPRRSSEQESMHELSSLSSIEEQPIRVTSNRQSSDSFNATPEHSNSFPSRNPRSSFSFEQQQSPQKILNQQSCSALVASPQNSDSSTSMYNPNPASMYEEQQPQESLNQPSVSSQHSSNRESDHRDLLTTEASPLRPSKKRKIN